MISKEIFVQQGKSIKKYNMVITKEYPKSKAASWIRQYYNGDRQNQENRQ